MNYVDFDERRFLSQPRARICHICGRLYGLHSFDIHIRQCKDLWIARESLKDKLERKSLPKDPTEGMECYKLSALADISKADLAEINRLASETYNNESLAICAYCGRSFLTEKLPSHNK